MPRLNIASGKSSETVSVPSGTLLGDAILQAGLPFEQPCAGRGTCGLCKVLVETGDMPIDPIEGENLSPGELALGTRLACRAKVTGDLSISLAPIVVYSNKVFQTSARHRRPGIPLGLAVDLGTTTVAAFIVTLDDHQVAEGGASLNQQAVYGADVISRLSAAMDTPQAAQRLRKQALASINQAIDSLKLSHSMRRRIERVSVVGNPVMHHLMLGYPVQELSAMPFQPHDASGIRDAARLMAGIFSPGVQVHLPPLVGGFVGSDALACLAFFGFDLSAGPMAAIDLGTNGEVMVTDGRRILAASTAAGPAFEGVNISCGSRAVEGAIIEAEVHGKDLRFQTLGDEPPIGLTGSGLLSLVYALMKTGTITPDGRLADHPIDLDGTIVVGSGGVRQLSLIPDRGLWLTQLDIRELQKAKAAILAAMEVLLARLHLRPEDLERVILTGSFGGEVEVEVALGLGMIPQVRPEIVEAVANGAGFGAALFLTDEGYALGEALADRCEQIDLDKDPQFNARFIDGLAFPLDERL